MISVFLGPSLPVAEARSLIDAQINPPAAMGDVLRAVTRGATAIAIIDGVFERAPAVWHKEILFALSRGIPVYGAASMGALRAAECHVFGMIGVGRVFEAFRDGELEDDDEVAVAHATAEHGFRSLSDAMVSIREAVAQAEQRKILSHEAGAKLLSEAKRRFYPDRHWTDIVRAATWMDVDSAQRLLTELPRVPDLKAADARLLLSQLSKLAEDGIAPHLPCFDFEPSSFWLSALTKECEVTARGQGESATLPRRRLSSHLRLVRPDRGELTREALFDLLVAAAASRLGHAPGGSDGSGFADCTDIEELRSRLDRATETLALTLRNQLEPFLAVALARRGQADEEIARAGHKSKLLAERGLEWPQLADAGIDAQALSDWYEQHFASLEAGGEAQAQALGFNSWEEFVSEIVAELMQRRSLADA